MEYALWVLLAASTLTAASQVLILVLMEYALWGSSISNNGTSIVLVLILVLMEYALWEYKSYYTNN